MDALDLLRAQHAEILGLFARTEALNVGDRWCALDILVEAIDLHLRVTPICAARVGFARERVAENRHSFERARDELTVLDPSDATFVHELSRVRDDVLRVCRREQQRLFPAIAQQLDRSARLALATDILAVIAQFECETDPCEANDQPAASI